MLSTTLEAIMKTISAAEANRHFSEVLREAKAALLARLGKRKASGARNWTRADLYGDEQ